MTEMCQYQYLRPNAGLFTIVDLVIFRICKFGKFNTARDGIRGLCAWNSPTMLQEGLYSSTYCLLTDKCNHASGQYVLHDASSIAASRDSGDVCPKEWGYSTPDHMADNTSWSILFSALCLYCKQIAQGSRQIACPIHS